MFRRKILVRVFQISMFNNQILSEFFIVVPTVVGGTRSFRFSPKHGVFKLWKNTLIIVLYYYTAVIVVHVIDVSW